MFPLGVVASDSSKDLTPRSLSSTVPASTLPPPPPPKNAARMLALALAESAQQVSSQSQPWSSETPTPLQAQEASNFQDLPHPVVPHFQTSSEEGAGRGTSPPPNTTATTVIAASYQTTSSPAIKQQPLEVTSMKLSDSAKASTVQAGIQLERDSTPPDTPLCKSTPLSSSTKLTSPTRKSPERHHSVTGQVPIQTGSSSTTPATTPSDSCKDTGIIPQPVLEVNVSFIYRYINIYLYCT